jgi:hypothetical protein
MKIIEKAASFLQETGLLAEINRVVLHPRGLALSIIAVPKLPEGSPGYDVTGFGPIYDKRDDEGIVLSAKDLAQGTAALRAAEADGRASLRPLRQERLGFVVQPAPDGAGAVPTTRSP